MPALVPANMHDIFVGFKTAYDGAFMGTPSTYQTIAMDVASTAREEKYPFMNSVPTFRQWVGDRAVAGLKLHGFAIENEHFESTISVSADDIADDRYGVFAPSFAMMGQNAKQHPDKLVYALLALGKTTRCYDGANFFDLNHVITGEGSVQTTVSNYQAGTGPTWYLIDTSKPVKPMVFQTRKPYTFVPFVRPDDQSVFWRNEFIYGVDARVAAGFALWQLAFASDAALTHDNYAAARAAMIAIVKENGDKMGVVPTHLVVPASLEGAARQVAKNELIVTTVNVGTPPVPQSVAVSNEWAGSVEVLMTPWL